MPETACSRTMTVAVRGGQWSDAGLELPDGFGAAVIDEMAEFAP